MKIVILAFINKPVFCEIFSFLHFFSKFCFAFRWSAFIICLYSVLISKKPQILTILEHFGQTFCQLSTLATHIAVFWAIDGIFSQNCVPVVFMTNIVSIFVLWYLNCLLIFYWASKLIWKCISWSPKRLSRKNRKIQGFQKNPYFVPYVCIKKFKNFLRQLLDTYVFGISMVLWDLF